MLDAGSDYGTISEELGIAKSYITKVKQQAIRNGHLTTGGKLIQAGYLVEGV